MAVAAPSFRSNSSFITLATHERRPLFQVSRIAELFIETLLSHRTRGYFKLHAFLVMPDHVHLLLTPLIEPLEQSITSIRRSFAHRLMSDNQVWAPGVIAHPVRNLRDLETVRTYLHQIPVRVRLVPSPELYPYSSAYRQVTKSAVATTTPASEPAS